MFIVRDVLVDKFEIVLEIFCLGVWGLVEYL